MVASCEYAYFAAPRSAQSLFMSLHFCAVGVGSFLGAAYMAFFSRIRSNYDSNPSCDQTEFSFQCSLSDKTNYWSLYTYFFVLAGIETIVIVIFILCQKKFTIVELNPQKMVNQQFR